MRPEVMLNTLRLARRSLAWWSVGIVALVALMVAVYPSVRDNPAMDRILESYPDLIQAFVAFGGIVDYTSAPGYLGAELFSMMLPLLFIIAAIVAGSKAVAGEEEAGTLEFLLSLPVSRTRVLAEKMAAVAAEVVILGAVLFVALLVGTAVTGMDVGAGGLAAASFDVVALAWLYGALAVLLGAAIGHRALAGGIAAALAVLAYVVNGLAPLVDAIDALRPLSPWYHYADSAALTTGLDPVNVAVLLGITAAFVLIAPPLLRRRDIGV